ncbi:hypothetical protein [Arthrobacter sp. M4]|uniref:hypothetical protein n=1 Tax=Arthrobacter sp. M4 TaxID=218160 RepID=UPI001CDCBFAB|nr:hypothetical protein [Arthrobacter sp. M4]MCA4134124.1 hypothetical protein [Arthrobacter sp. M4]
MQKLALMLLTVPGLLQETSNNMMSRRNNDIAPLLIVIPIAVIIAFGFVAAWFWYCQQRGAWPAFDMPSWQSGGTWKLYCAR